MKALFGVCIFDDKKIPGEGWSCRPGETPERITGVHDLANDLCWVTNLEYNAFMANNLSHLKHICQSQYFRQSLDFFLTDYGFKQGGNKAASEFLANHFNLTGLTGLNFLGINPVISRNNYRYSQLIANNISLPIWKQSPRGMPEALSDFIIENSTQQNQGMMGSRGVKTTTMHCYFPRLTYFRWLLSQRVPSSMDWTHLRTFDDGKIVGYKGGQISNDKMLLGLHRISIKNNSLPFFRITVLSQNKEYATFGAFGVGKSESRSWVTLPELLSLTRYAMVKIHEIYELPAGKVSDHIELIDDLANIKDISVSHGLFMENLAAAVMSPVNKKETAVGAYLRAYDRAACLVAAEKFYQAGIRVGSYSMGRIVLMADESQRVHVQKVAVSFGLVPFI